MNLDEVLNDAATWIVYGVGLASHLLVLIYGLGSPWWRSLLGVTIFAKWLSVAIVFDYLIARRAWGDFPGYGLTAIVVYGFMFLAFSAVVVEVVLERRRPTDEVAHHRKEIPAMSTPSTSVAIVNGQPTTVEPTTGEPTAKPTAKVVAGIVTAGALVVIEAAITAITPDLFSGLGPWGGVVFAGVVGLGGFIASYIKRP